MKKVKAKITWIIYKNRIPPIIDEKDRKTSLSYTPIIVFKGQYENDDWHMKPRWSSVIFNDEIKGKVSISTITYLFDTAPFELLRVGAEFELFEGPNKVATGIIIED